MQEDLIGGNGLLRGANNPTSSNSFFGQILIDQAEDGSILIGNGNIPEPKAKPLVSRNLATGAASPFAIFGPRIGVQSIADVLPGQRGRRVGIADLKIGL